MKPRIILNVILELVLAIVILLSGGCERHEDASTSTNAGATATTNANMPSTAPSMATAQVQISIDNFSFSPPTLTVAPGSRVTWINHDDVPHTVTSSTKAKPLASPAMDTDDKYSFVFTKPGTYEYYCAVHPHMTGKVIVK